MWCRVTRARYMECEQSDFNLNMYAFLICCVVRNLLCASGIYQSDRTCQCQMNFLAEK